MTKLKIEITIPVYNEEKELGKNILILHKFCEENLGQYNWQITIADNASDDATPAVAKALERRYQHVSYFRLEKKGRGRAVKKVWIESKADICVYMDLDLSTDLAHLSRIINVLHNGYDIAIGSRLAHGSKVEGRTLIREITSRALNFLFIQMFFHTRFTDAQCGFKGVTRRVVTTLLPKIIDDGWFFDGELLIVAEKSGYRIFEEPVHWVDNPGSTVRLLSTVWGDLKVMMRLMRVKPWIRKRSEIQDYEKYAASR